MALLDAAPLLGLVPRFCCYFLALLAALQCVSLKTKKKGTGVLHGVKALKALCVVFTRLSSWYGTLAQAGPWQYQWDPPMRQLQRILSACVLITLCLPDAAHLPTDDALMQAAQQVDRIQRNSAEWKSLVDAHAQLDATPTVNQVSVLAAALAQAAAPAMHTNELE